MSNFEQIGTPTKKTYWVMPETYDNLNYLKREFGYSSTGKVIDHLVQQEMKNEETLTSQMAQLLLLAKTTLKAVDNDNDQLVALTEVINNIALAKLWPTDFVSMKVNTHPLFTAAEAEAKKKRIEKIKSAQYRLKR